jgi:hypothetical protein
MRLLTSILFLAAAGCVGSIGDENPGDDPKDPDPNPTDTRTAKEMFTADVHPAVAKCSGGACHDINATASPALSKFYNADASTSYDATVNTTALIGSPAFTSLAPILTHVQAGHKGLAYTPDEASKITNWLAAETKERADNPDLPPPFDAVAALKEWSGCMSLENFNAANMAPAWSTLAADNLQKCLNCHVGGVAGFYISCNATNFFNAISTQAAYLIKYFGVDGAARKVIVNTGAFESANKIGGHPTFPVDTNAGMIALKKFYESTLARKELNQCDPPRLIDP